MHYEYVLMFHINHQFGKIILFIDNINEIILCLIYLK